MCVVREALCVCVCVVCVCVCVRGCVCACVGVGHVPCFNLEASPTLTGELK